MADISTHYLGLELRNPIIAGSSGLTNTLENIIKISDHGAGAVVLKSLFEEQINFAVKSTYSQQDSNFAYPEALDYISHYTREDDLERYLNLIRESKKAVDIPIIASINCVTAAEWVSFAKSIQEAGADAIELNIFILPSDPRRKADQQEQIYFDIIKAVMKNVKIPVSAKISYYFSGLANMALQLSWTGISGLVLFNRYYSPDINIDNLEITSGHVYSTPGESALTLRWIAMLSDKVQCDIAASTGIHDGKAMIKQLLAGAKAVQVASVLYLKGFGQIEVMRDELSGWMDRHNYATTKDFTGKLSYKGAENPAAYERVQFMKHFSGIE